MEEEKKNRIASTINESEIVGEKIIFDISIKDKLAHVIVIKDGYDYHINLDGEDLGHFCKDDEGVIHRYPQPKGANNDLSAYFEPVEVKLKEIGK